MTPRARRTTKRELALRLAPIACALLGCSDTHAVDPRVDNACSTTCEPDAGSTGAGGGGDPGPNELPCDVREVVEAICAGCHSSPVSSGAIMPLVSRYDFLAPSAFPGQTLGQRSVERMKSATAPMPPKSEPPALEARVAVLEQWVAAGMPPGECGALPAKPAETTCTSGQMWDEMATPTAEMNPGHACRACHKTKAPEFNYFFMGTVFPTFHEKDLCISPPNVGGKVEILDEMGNVTMTLTPNGSGNFMSSAVAAGVPLPYTARLVANGLARSMTTKQTDGDCNKCHSEQGAEDAPGRLKWPGTYEPLPPPPPAPVLDSVEPMAGALHVTWSADGCDKILLFRKKDAMPYALAYSLSGSATFQHDDGADAIGSVYCYVAQCRVALVDSEDSNELCGSPE